MTRTLSARRLINLNLRGRLVVAAVHAGPVPRFAVSVQAEETERRRLLQDILFREALDAADLRFGS